ncbi:FAD:protein FMN transferase [Enterococcus timonensis]|uniref:FAD:protein FMN transferase n=1 Tax=Enterococcus timonensis TaxID=1852364 RepID=UPI0009F48385|nr:FAD:protein FMN transferase [Enterococcus timonensis]
MSKKILAGAALLSLSVLLLASCTSQSGTDQTNESTTTSQKINTKAYEDQQFLLGTYVDIRIFDNGKESVLEDAFARVKELGDKITVNQEGSEVDAVNANAGVAPVKVSDDVYRLAKEALKYSEDSNGGFDMAIGPITAMWHIGFDDARKPSQEEIDAALTLVDYTKVQFDDEAQTIYLTEKGMALDFGAIAKGFITDEVVEVLKNSGVTCAIVDLGGNVYVLGNSSRSTAEEKIDWTVGIQDPNQARNVILGQLPESNKSLVTSGIYERYLKVDGKTYHHLFDPKTGYPFDNDIAGVTIVTEKSVDGDGLSTAVFSMGVKNGLAYVETLDDVDAIFVTTEGKVFVTSGIEETFTLSEESGYTMGETGDLQ